ncbi:MAG: Ig-like domain-containing protein [Myxococcota bacterium]
MKKHSMWAWALALVVFAACGDDETTDATTDTTDTTDDTTDTTDTTDMPMLTGIAVTPATFDLTSIGATQQLTVTGQFDMGPDMELTEDVVFSTSDDTVATVSENAGLVTAVSEGTATITATEVNTGETAEATVTVTTEEPGPSCEVAQDFESLDANSATALSDDGWLVFANVFDAGGTFLFSFGPNPAPNATVSPDDTFISAVVTGEGDASQGEQQLSVFNDYNCCDLTTGSPQGHGNGTDRVEVNVFQEINSIPASFIGQTLTFSFDAKRGNIEGATTARAFITTLDPNSGFSQTNFVEVDVTSIPDTWARYEISLDLSDPALEGQILQVGFRNTASDFEGSGIFYDNVEACLSEAGGGTCTVDEDCPDDGNECTAEMCTEEGTCESTNVADGTECDSGAGTCQAGVCTSTGPVACEYEQDFESLDASSATALGDDGWLVFANVFDAVGNFLFSFGPNPAPNATVSPGDTFISAVVTGEGDAPQGEQQLSVFNDYNCCDLTTGSPQGHGNGTDRVEVNVFQEINPIPASFIGQTFTFSFDAKRGNIEGDTTARAFITTLDPNSGFSQTNFVEVDLTNIPDTWAAYEISVDLSDPALEGQILQAGFRNTASDFEGSSIFYDNITFGPTGCSGSGNGGNGGSSGDELTTNGDFETGDFMGWTNFCDNGSCTITDQNPNGGQFAANIVVNTPAQNAVIKNANIGIGEVAPGDQVSIGLFIRGSAVDGGVVFVELFAEMDGGGASETQTFGPFFPTDDWVEINQVTTIGAGADVSGGITVQVAAITGGAATSAVDLFVDDVTVTSP